jgi:hypothetical protein
MQTIVGVACIAYPLRLQYSMHDVWLSLIFMPNTVVIPLNGYQSIMPSSLSADHQCVRYANEHQFRSTTILLPPLELDIPPPRPLHALYWQFDTSLTWVTEGHSLPSQENTLTSTYNICYAYFLNLLAKSRLRWWHLYKWVGFQKFRRPLLSPSSRLHNGESQ